MNQFLSAITLISTALPALAEEVTLSEPTDLDPFWADRHCIEDVIRGFTALDNTIFENIDVRPVMEFGQITGSGFAQGTFREFSVTFDDQVNNQVQVIALRHDFTTESPFAIDAFNNTPPYSAHAQHLLSPDASVIGLTGYFSSLLDDTGETPPLGYNVLEQLEAFTDEVLRCSNLVLG